MRGCSRRDIALRRGEIMETEKVKAVKGRGPRDHGGAVMVKQKKGKKKNRRAVAGSIPQTRRRIRQAAKKGKW